MSNRTSRLLNRAVKPQLLEQLEDRCLLSASAHPHNIGATIPFSLAPAAVQTGLDTLAATDGFTAPTATQSVYLGNTKGIETYTVDLSSNGGSVLTVDVNGNVVTKPVASSTTFGAITNTAVTDEFNAIAAALNLTAPTSTSVVNVLTNTDGTAVYTLSFGSSATPVVATTSALKGKAKKHFSGGGNYSNTYSVDSNGNPTGNESVPLSVLSSAIQNGLTSNAPANSTPLNSTDLVSVATKNGVTTYSAKYTVTTSTTPVILTVDSTGALAALPSTSTVQFSTIPTVTQTELQTLATNDGYVGTIPATQSVTAYDEANGTIIYAVKLPVTGTNSTSGATFTFLITVAADQIGNPTVPPRHGHGGCDDGGDDDNGGGGWTCGGGSFNGGGGDWNGGGGCSGGSGGSDDNGDNGDSGGTSTTGGSNGTTSGNTTLSGNSKFSGFSKILLSKNYRD